MLDLNKGDKVILKGFTGIKLGVFEVKSTTKKTVSILKANGDELIFDRKTGKQVNVEEGKEKYANSIMEDDGSFVPPTRKKSAKKAEAPKKSKKQPEPEDEEDDDDDEDDEEEDKPVKKSSKKSKKVKSEEDDEDEYEEA